MNINAIKANEPGALDGFGATCPECGMTIASSLRTIAEHDVAAHAAWHARTAR